MKLISRLKFSMMRLDLKSQIRDVVVMLGFLIGVILFHQFILVRFLPLGLVFIFLLLSYYFLIRKKNDGDSLGIRLISMGIVGALVMGFLVNNILFGIESYINQKYTADNTMIYCRSYGRIATRLLLDRCISSNKEAEKEANFIISATGWAYEVPFFLGALIEIRRRREIARVLKNKIN